MICPRISVDGSVPKHVSVELPFAVALKSVPLENGDSDGVKAVVIIGD